MNGDDGLHRAIVQAALSTFAALPANGKPRRRSNRAPEWTVLAAVCLFRAAGRGYDVRCVSLGTGLKALPHARLPVHGDVLHDSHAEVVARRGFKRWLYCQIERAPGEADGSAQAEPDLFVERLDGDEWRLKNGWKVGMYISTLPCGDASTYYLSLSAPAVVKVYTAPSSETGSATISMQPSAASASPMQTPSLAVAASLGMNTSRDPASNSRTPASPSSSAYLSLAPLAVNRGRASYTTFSILRTKPGRADSPPTISHSCSDKLAAWALLGLQGALLSQLGMRRVPLECVVVGGLAPWAEDARERIRAECVRAVGGRLEAWARTLGLGEEDFRVPDVLFTREEFDGAKEVVARREGVEVGEVVGSVSFVAGKSSPAVEVINNGIRQGASPKRKPGQPLGIKIRSRLSKLSLYQQHLAVSTALAPSLPLASPRTDEVVAAAAFPPSDTRGDATSASPPSPSCTYYTAKHPPSPRQPSLPLTAATLASLSPGAQYTLLKTLLRAPATAPGNSGGPFAGWLVSGRGWESFDAEGRVAQPLLEGKGVGSADAAGDVQLGR